jgi:hypothetical protein
MHWLLHNFLSETAWDALVAALERFEIDYSVHDVVPKVGDLLPEPQLSHQSVICIGSYSMRHPATKNGWNPGVFDLFAQDFEQRWSNCRRQESKHRIKPIQRQNHNVKTSVQKRCASFILPTGAIRFWASSFHPAAILNLFWRRSRRSSDALLQVLLIRCDIMSELTIDSL